MSDVIDEKNIPEQRLESSLGDPLSSLEKVRNRNHPDTTGGDFKSDQQKEAYLAADQALRELKPAEGTTAVAVMQTQHRELLEVMRENQKMVHATQRAQQLQTLEETAKRGIVAATRDHFHPFKLSSWGFGAFAAVLLALKDPIGELAPALGLQTPHLQLAFAALAIYGGIGGFFFQMQEKKTASRQSWLLTEDGLQKFIRSPEFAEAVHPFEDKYILSLDRLVDAVVRFMPGGLELQTAQNLSEVILEKLCSRELTTREAGAFISPTYTVYRGFAEHIVHK